MPSYPSTLPNPKAGSFTLGAKALTKSMKTDKFDIRRRKMSTGERYVGNVSFDLSCDSLQDEFLKFVKYDINYGDYWFDADWFEELGFVAGEWVFRFIDTKFKDSGWLSKNNYSYLMAPRSEILGSGDGLPENTWPISEGSNGLIVNNLLINGADAQADGVDLVVDTVPTQVGIPTAQDFYRLTNDNSGGASYQAASTEHPSGQGMWTDIGNPIFSISATSLAPFLGAGLPTGPTALGVDWLSGWAGAIAGNHSFNSCGGYGEMYTNDAGLFPDAQDNIDAGIMEFEFAAYEMIGNSAGPTINTTLQFLSLTKNILYENAFPTYSTNDDEAFNEIRCSGIMPSGTRFIRLKVEMTKNNGSIAWAYAFVLDAIIAYRTAT